MEPKPRGARPSLFSSPTLRRWGQVLRDHAPPVNFITIHYTYFIVVSLISSGILYGSCTDGYSISYIDALFMTVSAMSLAGLNTVLISQMNTFQQILLFVLIIMGSAILISFFVIYLRRRAFEKRFVNIVEQEKRLSRERSRSRAMTISSRLGWHSEKSKAGEEKPIEMDSKSQGVVVEGRVIPGVSVSDEDSTDTTTEKHADAEEHAPSGEQSIHRLSQDTEPFPDLIPGPGLSANHRKFHATNRPEMIVVKSQNTAVSSGTDLGEPRPDAVLSPTAKSIRFSELGSPRTPLFQVIGVGARHEISNHPNRAPPTPSIIPDREEISIAQILKGKFAGRNSQLSMLTNKERERLGGVEYRALGILERVIMAYFILFQVLGSIAVASWTAVYAPQIATSNGLNPWWVGIFNAVSAFNDSGMSLLDANMIPYQSAYYVLLTMSLLIIAGNTCYPVFLRLIFWTMWKLTPDSWTEYKIALRFILSYPRRVYTHLFPPYHTYFLLASVVILNAFDWIAFEILNIGNPYVQTIPTNDRIVDGLFQAFSVRSGGFAVVQIGELAIGVQVLYVLMMYISVYPVAMSIRNSNVYEERSLGIYTSQIRQADEEALKHLRRRLTNVSFFRQTGTKSRYYFIKQQIRSQLSHDMWWICISVFLIVVIEGDNFSADPIDYSVFNIILEVVSAYGSVGFSVGLPSFSGSFSGGWHSLSKLILCFVMLRGRHRGLPVAIDRAVLLPSEALTNAEEEDARLKRDATFSQSGMDFVLSPT